jgi:hypothetical protein
MLFVDTVLDIVVWVKVEEIVWSCSDNDDDWNNQKDVERSEEFLVFLRLGMGDVNLRKGRFNVFRLHLGGG